MKSEASHSEFRERAVRYLSGEMGSEKRHSFEQELAGDEEKQRIFNEFHSIWSGVEQLAANSKYDLDAEWEQFSGKIDLETEINQRSRKTDPEGEINQRSRKIDLETEINQLSRKIDPEAEINPPFRKTDPEGEINQPLRKTEPEGVRTMPRRVFAWRIAAVLVAGLAGLAGWLVLRDHISYEQIAVEQGSEVVELADGSVVTLNAGSTFRYDLEDPEQRRVILEGEAFFEIARDPSRPFIIDAGSAVVEVLGTSFNVNAYKERGVVEVTVATGLVTMSAKHRMDNQIILNPGNSGVYDENEKKLELISNADPNVMAWKTRQIMFDKTPLGEVVKVISHVYQTDIQLASASLASCPITVSFKDQELGAVLTVITSTLDLQMERREGAVILSGEGCD